MGGFLLFLGLFCLICGLVSLFKPLTVLRINDRGTAAGVLVFGIVLSLAGLGQLGGSSTPATSGNAPPVTLSAPAAPVKSEVPVKSEPPPKPDLELVESHPETAEFGVRMVAGTVKNNSNREYGYVQVEINLYDAAGNQLGSRIPGQGRHRLLGPAHSGAGGSTPRFPWRAGEWWPRNSCGGTTKSSSPGTP